MILGVLEFKTSLLLVLPYVTPDAGGGQGPAGPLGSPLSFDLAHLSHVGVPLLREGPQPWVVVPSHVHGWCEPQGPNCQQWV